MDEFKTNNKIPVLVCFTIHFEDAPSVNDDAFYLIEGFTVEGINKAKKDIERRVEPGNRKLDRVSIINIIQLKDEQI